MAIQQGKKTVVGMKDEDLPSDIAALPLDAGEKQVLCLALRDKADLVLFDDEKVREEAKLRGLNVKGTLGVVIQAHHPAPSGTDGLFTKPSNLPRKDQRAKGLE